MIKSLRELFNKLTSKEPSPKWKYIGVDDVVVRFGETPEFIREQRIKAMIASETKSLSFGSAPIIEFDSDNNCAREAESFCGRPLTPEEVDAKFENIYKENVNQFLTKRFLERQ